MDAHKKANRAFREKYRVWQKKRFFLSLRFYPVQGSILSSLFSAKFTYVHSAVRDIEMGAAT
jgi:hypothetical protein